TFTDAKKPAQQLFVGKQRPNKDEYFAKLSTSPAVFVVKKEVRDLLDRDPLAYRPAQPWQLKADQIAVRRVRKDGQEYQLKRDGQNWRITTPFEAAAVADQVRPMVEELTGLRAERYVAHKADDLGKYGLDKPALTVTVVPEAKKDGDAA